MRRENERRKGKIHIWLNFYFYINDFLATIITLEREENGIEGEERKGEERGEEREREEERGEKRKGEERNVKRGELKVFMDQQKKIRWG
jgi:hypothetical protein